MKKFLIVLAIIIFVPLIGLITFLKLANFNNYKPQIEALALKYANMIVKINGDLKIGVSLKPSIELNAVSVAQAENNQPVAQIGQAQVQFSLLPLLKKEIVVNTVKTSDTNVFYSDKDSVEIKNLAVGMDSFDSPITMSFDTVVSGIQITGEGKTSSFKSIQDSEYNDVDAALQVNALGYTLNYEGGVKGISKGLTSDGAYEINYKSNKINGNVSADLTGETPYLKLNAASDNLNVYEFSETKTSENNWLISEAKANELIKNTPIPYDVLKSVNADVNIDLKTVNITPDMALTDILTDLTLKNGVFKADIKNISGGDGVIKGSASLNANAKNMAVNLNGSNIVLQKLNKDFANSGNEVLYVKSGGKTDFNIKLNTSGADTDQYLANMDGQVVAIIDPSVMNVKSLERLQGNIIVQIFNNLKLNIVNKDMNLNCAVVRSDIKKGVAEFPKGIAFDANDFYVVADGSVNLYNEKIDLDLQPFSGRITDTNVSSVLGSLLSISGTMSNPSVGINKTQTAKAVVGIIATGGLYNAGDMLLSADSSPCHTALQGTSYASHFKAAKGGVKNDASKTYSDTKDAVKKSLTDTKDTVKDLGNQAGNLLKGLVK
ncbi:MAG: AsmA family protein [Alphaproteobacteria bacterium]|nr:AsmA family protein [Alphaproteobacteria bacterium]